MSIPTTGGPAPSVNFNTGGAAGTLLGGSTLQQSIDTLNTSVNNLTSTIGTLTSPGRFNQQQTPTVNPNQPGGGGFPPVNNPFNNNQNQPGIGGGGPGGTGNVQPPTPFGQIAAGAGGVAGAFIGYGNQQLPIQLGLNAYATQTALAMGQTSGNFTTQYRQAFGYQNQNLNFLASSPLDAIAGTQMLQSLAGNPLYRSSSIGQAGYGYTAGFGLANPLASLQTSASFAQQILSPQVSQAMLALGYPVTPRQLGTGKANLPANVIQGLLRAWYGQKDVNPNTLTAGLGIYGKDTLSLNALGINSSGAAPLIEEYNQLFRKGLTPQQAQNLINQAGSGDVATAKSAQDRLSRLGVKTATSSAQALRNNQAVLTGRDANIASGFSRGLQDATGLLVRFNAALSAIMTTLHLNGITGFAGGFGTVFGGSNFGNTALGLSGAGSLFKGLGSVLGGLFSLSAGGIIPGYMPGKDDVPAKLSRGEAVLNPGAATALGHGRINALNAMYSAPGAKSEISNGILHAAGGAVPGGSGGKKQGISGYNNPFRGVHNLQPERIDMGVDYSGSGPIYAIGPGIVTNNNTSWAGAVGAPYPGYFISYKLTGGPDAGQYVYVAEDVWPSVKVGQRVTSNTVIGNMRGGIETGWAAPPGTGQTMAAKYGQIGQGGDPGSVSSAYGISFSQLLASLGAPPGQRQANVVGSAPSPFGSSSGGNSGQSGSAGSGSLGIGFSESSLIPDISELSALAGIFDGGGMSSSGSSRMGTGNPNTPNGGFGNVPGQGGSRAQNKALMMKLAAKYGWNSGPMWEALNNLVMSESGYDNHAQNPTSTAYGIGQFLNSTWAGFGPKTSNPRLQEIYMLEYIKQRYKNPEAAWSFHMANNWYSEGGRPPAGSVGVVGDRGPELVDFGVGGGVLSNSRTNDLLNGTHALPAQTPWSNFDLVGNANNPFYTSSSSPVVNLNFSRESICIKIDGSQYTDASDAGTQAAKGFMKYLDNENLFRSISIGDKTGNG